MEIVLIDLGKLGKSRFWHDNFEDISDFLEEIYERLQEACLRIYYIILIKAYFDRRKIRKEITDDQYYKHIYTMRLNYIVFRETTDLIHNLLHCYV